MWQARPISQPYRVAVSLVASRQLARMGAALASRVRQELHAVAERAAQLSGAGGRTGSEPLTLRLQVEGYLAQVDIQPAEELVTLRGIDTTL